MCPGSSDGRTFASASPGSTGSQVARATPMRRGPDRGPWRGHRRAPAVRDRARGGVRDRLPGAASSTHWQDHIVAALLVRSAATPSGSSTAIVSLPRRSARASSRAGTRRRVIGQPLPPSPPGAGLRVGDRGSRDGRACSSPGATGSSSSPWAATGERSPSPRREAGARLALRASAAAVLCRRGAAPERARAAGLRPLLG